METSTMHRSPMKRAWFVIYTRPRWEKKVNDSLVQQGIISFCPLRTVRNQWADRQKLVSVPLFSSYVFVHINLKEELAVRMTSGVLNFVYYQGKPAQVKDNIIEGIKTSLKRFPDAEVVDFHSLDVGTRVKIRSGLMQEKEGFVLKKQLHHIVVVIDSLNCVLMTKVPAENLELVNLND